MQNHGPEDRRIHERGRYKLDYFTAGAAMMPLTLRKSYVHCIDCGVDADWAIEDYPECHQWMRHFGLVYHCKECTERLSPQGIVYYPTKDLASRAAFNDSSKEDTSGHLA
jgi:hypothetical protein